MLKEQFLMTSVSLLLINSMNLFCIVVGDGLKA